MQITSVFLLTKQLIFTVRGKVMFSQACVKNSGGEGGRAWQGICMVGGVCVVGCSWQGACVVGACMAGACVVGGGMCGRGCVWQGVCVTGGVCGRGGGMRGRRDGHCSGRYASYWNAFLLHLGGHLQSSSGGWKRTHCVAQWIHFGRWPQPCREEAGSRCGSSAGDDNGGSRWQHCCCQRKQLVRFAKIIMLLRIFLQFWLSNFHRKKKLLKKSEIFTGWLRREGETIILQQVGY